MTRSSLFVITTVQVIGFSASTFWHRACRAKILFRSGQRSFAISISAKVGSIFSRLRHASGCIAFQNCSFINFSSSDNWRLVAWLSRRNLSLVCLITYTPTNAKRASKSRTSKPRCPRLQGLFWGKRASSLLASKLPAAIALVKYSRAFDKSFSTAVPSRYRSPMRSKP